MRKARTKKRGRACRKHGFLVESGIMSAKLTTADIDHIIDLIEQIAKTATKTDFLSSKEQKEIPEIKYDNKKATILEARDRSLRAKHIKQNLPNLQEKLRYYLAPRWPELLRLCSNPRKFKKDEIIYYFVEKTVSTSNFNPELILGQAKEKITELKDIRAKIEYQNKIISPEEATNLVKGKKITVIFDTRPCNN